MADDNYKKSSSLISTMVPIPTDDDLITELTHQMSRFMLQEDDDNHSFDFSSNSELPWDLTSSPDSTLWSPSFNQGSSEGSSQEPSPPVTPCWNTTTYEERSISKHNIDHGVLSSHKALIQEQIKAIEVKQHYINDIKKQNQQAMSPKQNETKEEIEKKGNGRNRVLPRLPRPTPLQISGGGVGGGGMRAVFIGDSGPRNGTGVFLPRGRTGTVVVPSESTKKKQGKGCSTVLIPARVVQALQLHFHKTAAISRGGPKVVDFPPLRDLVLSNREGMYSLDENQQSTKSPNDVQNDMILPNEWTY